VAATPYSTGGGGTNFEQAFAATQLVALLRGDSVQLLGDDVRLGSVRFQAASVSDVDDLLLRSDPIDGPVRTVSVALRHDPTIAPGDVDFVSLLATVANTVSANRDACRAGSWSVGLVVAAPHAGAKTLAPVTDLARATPITDEFEKAVQAARGELRQRYDWFSQALDKAIAGGRFTGDAGTHGSLQRAAFRHDVLSALHVLQQDVEGGQAEDRSRSIHQLAELTPGLTEAVDVWNALIAVVAIANPAGATLTEATLRRRLPPHHVNSGARRAVQLATLTTLEEGLRGRVRTQLVQPGAPGATPPGPLRLARQAALEDLTASITRAVAALIVTGPADTGKSTLTVEAITALRASGAHVVALHAADATGIGTAADPFGGLFGDTLGCATTAASRYLVVDGAETAVAADDLRPLLAAGLEAGYRPVVVVRDDAVEDVQDVVTAVMAAAGEVTAPQQHIVGVLVEQEIAEIVAHFPALATVAARPRHRPPVAPWPGRHHPARLPDPCSRRQPAD
jgi:molybdopterin-guanine dinucleotide biosynthesis protein